MLGERSGQFNLSGKFISKLPSVFVTVIPSAAVSRMCKEKPNILVFNEYSFWPGVTVGYRVPCRASNASVEMLRLI